ncbi:UNVERIFIED_CONTAM: hypothetical protein GTU68_004622 [Idotea baltica]|nr:hypothetical protein [Idotea baltica]
MAGFWRSLVAMIPFRKKTKISAHWISKLSTNGSETELKCLTP